jgi:hypothetical protein
MNKNLLIVLGIIVLAVVAFFVYKPASAPVPAGPTADEQAVRQVVTDFGKKLQNVTLSASPQILKQAITDNYSSFVSADLLTAWLANPERAPGRLTSSPWPDRIEIIEITKEDDGAYEVQAKVVEITSTEAVSGGVAAEYPVALKLRAQNGQWRITGFSKALLQ